MTTRSADNDRSTLGSLPSGRTRSSAAIWVRRIVTLLLVALVAVAGTGLLGVHSRSVTAAGNGYELEIEYAGIARAGLDVPFRITVRSDRPWGQEITVAINRDYFALFETQGFHPEPSGEAAQGSDLWLTFDTPPDGGPLVVDYDAYIQPASQVGSSGTVSVIAGGRVMVSAGFNTFLFP